MEERNSNRSLGIAIGEEMQVDNIDFHEVEFNHSIFHYLRLKAQHPDMAMYSASEDDMPRIKCMPDLREKSYGSHDRPYQEMLANRNFESESTTPLEPALAHKELSTDITTIQKSRFDIHLVDDHILGCSIGNGIF
ncbi:hypothetical protein Tco_0775182 [Tanacetum coccineum]